MKYSIIGIILLVLVLSGLYVYTESGSQDSSVVAPVAPQNDNGQYNIKIE